VPVSLQPPGTVDNDSTVTASGFMALRFHAKRIADDGVITVIPEGVSPLLWNAPQVNANCTTYRHSGRPRQAVDARCKVDMDSVAIPQRWGLSAGLQIEDEETGMDLAETLQRLYDSEINVTITWLWDGGFEFALISPMEWEAVRPIDHLTVIASNEPHQRPKWPNPWHSVERADQLAQAIHDAALEKYPDSSYAKLYGRLN
jgi:hypothetical protein